MEGPVGWEPNGGRTTALELFSFLNLHYLGPTPLPTPSNQHPTVVTCYSMLAGGASATGNRKGG